MMHVWHHAVSCPGHPWWSKNAITFCMYPTSRLGQIFASGNWTISVNSADDDLAVSSVSSVNCMQHHAGVRFFVVAWYACTMLSWATELSWATTLGYLWYPGVVACSGQHLYPWWPTAGLHAGRSLGGHQTENCTVTSYVVDSKKVDPVVRIAMHRSSPIFWLLSLLWLLLYLSESSCSL